LGPREADGDRGAWLDQTAWGGCVAVTVVRIRTPTTKGKGECGGTMAGLCRGCSLSLVALRSCARGRDAVGPWSADVARALASRLVRSRRGVGTLARSVACAAGWAWHGGEEE
jgi:hypothetical protein